MITGFNTDIEHDGVVYHVQTEDKGLDSPIILSLVYSGGAILASKRSPYEDLIAEGFTDEALSERLKRQHRLICAAIHSGRINDLKKMGLRTEEVQPVDADSVPHPVFEPLPEKVQRPPAIEEAFEIEYLPASQEWTPPPPPEEAAPPAPPEQEIPVGEHELQPVEYSVQNEAGTTQQQIFAEVVEEGLVITLFDDDEFYSGDARTLRLFVGHRSGTDEKALRDVAVSIKILGTTFRPLIYSVKTDRDGFAEVSTEIPKFTSGRAAVLIRAVTKDQAAELRRVIHPGK